MKTIKQWMSAFLCGTLLVCSLGSGLTVSAYSGSAPKEKTTGTNLRVMSYNVLVDNDKSLGGWDWGQPLGTRGDKASACIKYYQPDVIGFQECNYKWHVSLRTNLPDYDFVNADVPKQQYLEDKNSLGKKDWMCTTMMYNTKTLTLLNNELIGYSVNYWGCIQRMRYISMALFEIKATGEQFVFLSTHLDAEKDAKGQQNRVIQTGEMAKRIEYYKHVYGCPIIATGDFNSNYSDAPIQQLVEVGMTSHANNRGGIDYVLYSAGVEAKYFTVVNDSDVSGASDHKPIFADVQVGRNPYNAASVFSDAQTSRMEMKNGRLGLAFAFDVAATGVVKGPKYVANLSGAKVCPLGSQEYSLLAMGAVVSNDPVIGTRPEKMNLDNLSEKTVNAPAEYLTNATADKASFAVRVINIPQDCSDMMVYVRPYYIYECENQLLLVYGDIYQGNYDDRADMNDGVLDWEDK